MNKETIIEILKKRKKVFRKMMKEEERQCERLKHKTQSVRLSSPHIPRLNWYTDRCQELELIISLLEEGIKENDFIHHLLDDNSGLICLGIGNACNH